MKNLVQATKEAHLVDILKKRSQDIVVVMYSSKSCPPCKEFKPFFVETATNTPDCFFVYVDNTKFETTSERFFKQYTPTIGFYINDQEIGTMVGGDRDKFTETLKDLRTFVEQKKVEYEEMLKQQQSQQAEMEEKQQLLNALYQLANDYNFDLTNFYDLNSDINAIKIEYDFHKKRLAQQNSTPVQSEQNTESHEPVEPVKLDIDLDNVDPNNTEHLIQLLQMVQQQKKIEEDVTHEIPDEVMKQQEQDVEEKKAKLSRDEMIAKIEELARANVYSYMQKMYQVNQYMKLREDKIRREQKEAEYS